jgi:hypothetical protein
VAPNAATRAIILIVIVYFAKLTDGFPQPSDPSTAPRAPLAPLPTVAPVPPPPFPPFARPVPPRQAPKGSLRHFAPHDLLDGIVAYLTAECGGNIHDQDIVRVTSSGDRMNKRSYAAKNMVDLRADTIFASPYRGKTEAMTHGWNHWICYEFRRHIIIPTHYSIRSFLDGAPYCPNLKSWILEVSIDGEHWEELDH